MYLNPVIRFTKLTLKIFSTFRMSPLFPTLFLRIFMQEPQYSHKQRTEKYCILLMQISDVIKPDLLSSTYRRLDKKWLSRISPWMVSPPVYDIALNW